LVIFIFGSQPLRVKLRGRDRVESCPNSIDSISIGITTASIHSRLYFNEIARQKHRELEMQMIIRTIALLATASILAAGNAIACLGDAPPVTDKDLQYPPANMAAFRAKITKIVNRGSLDGGKPHGGFELKLKIIQVFQGRDLGETIAVSYGGCHNLPGKQGEEVNVLALKDRNKGWYAPQFWRRRTKVLNRLGS
jgi:hypothetical protein